MILNKSAQSSFLKLCFFFPSRWVHYFCHSIGIYYMHLKWKQTRISVLTAAVRETWVNTSFSGSLRRCARLLSKETRPSHRINKDVLRRWHRTIRLMLWFKGVSWFTYHSISDGLLMLIFKKGTFIITNKSLLNLETMHKDSTVFVNIMSCHILESPDDLVSVIQGSVLLFRH